MTKIRFTSAGSLLIAAIVMAGGIVLLDLFFLGPYAESQKQTALVERARRIEQGFQQSLCDGQNDLLAACTDAARRPEMSAALRAHDAQRFTTLADGLFAQSNASTAWLLDAEKHVVAHWPQSDVPARTGAADGNELARTIQDVYRRGHGGGPDPARDTSPLGTSSNVGLVRTPAGVAVMAFASVAAEDGRQGCLCLVWEFEPRLLKSIGQAIGGSVVFVPGPRASTTGPADNSTEPAVWSFNGGMLAMAWEAVDLAGRGIGCFQAKAPMPEITNQAAAARRAVLIVLALSLGLVLLVIMGVHILVAGPVVRLLRRLQQIDTGDDEITGLTRDLHGESLVLARKLESVFQRLTHISKTDQLTGLANRSHFAQMLEWFYHQSRRYNRPLSLMMIDVDRFKTVNDTAGHQAGDEAIKLVSAHIQSACRKADMPARLGGDEFAVLLPETCCTDAERVAGRILTSINAQPITVGRLQMNLTVSIGLADLNSGEIADPEEMISLVDQALYAAKETGRNRIVLAQNLPGNKGQSPFHDTRKVDGLCNDLIGLDNQYQDLFLRAVKDVVGVLESRDPHMADHARRVQHFTALIAREMGLPERFTQRIAAAAMLHDIGMLAMPDSVLLCPGRLDLEQLERMRQHPLLSVRVMERMEFLEQEIPAVRYHHERFDGKGYPEGLVGPAIPVGARILAVADAFEAVTSQRLYRKAMTVAEGLAELQKNAGTQFDPQVTEALAAAVARLGDAIMNVSVPATPSSRWRDNTVEVRDADPVSEAAAQSR